MSKEKIKNRNFDDGLNEQPPEFDPIPDGYRSPILMRIMLIVINIAAFLFCRSFLQSWYSIHGSTPVWIPLAFLIVPLGSLFFIYYYMGKVGYERIMKTICIAFCALGIDFPSEGSATTVDGKTAERENHSSLTFLKSFIKGERLFTCTDVIYSDEQAKIFEKSIAASPVWLKEIPDRLGGLAYSALDSSGYDCILFFNCNTKKFNSLPESGEHTFYQVMYNLQNHELRILKYTKNF